MIVPTVVMNFGMKSTVRISMIFYTSDVATRLMDVIFALHVFTYGSHQQDK